MSESTEQAALLTWAALQAGRYPELALLFHVPNGEKRAKSTAARLQAQGVKAGVPDLMLPVSRHGYHGLWIEMKATGGRLSPAQRTWIDALRLQGYRVSVCYGWEAARDELDAYLADW
jgi:hypothetical protein